MGSEGDIPFQRHYCIKAFDPKKNAMKADATPPPSFLFRLEPARSESMD